VRKGDKLGMLHVKEDVAGLAVGRLVLRSPKTGVVIGRTENPLVTVGDALVHIAEVG